MDDLFWLSVLRICGLKIVDLHEWLIALSPRCQANAGDFIYIFYGTMDKPDELPPKGEFFCKYRDSWMPEVPGMYTGSFNIPLIENPTSIPTPLLKTMQIPEWV